MTGPEHSAASPASTERATAALIARIPGAPASFKAAALACLNLRGGRLRMRIPDGRVLLFGDDGPMETELDVRSFAFARRVVSGGDIGFAEGFIAGEWDTPDLSALLFFLSSNTERIAKVFFGGPFGRLSHWLRHVSRENSKAGAKRNILAHYDLGNRFYERWLDRTMTYSSALAYDRTRPLSEAQLVKYRAIARHLKLQPGDRVLEIGCGWGGFAEVAAGEFGASVTGLTISNEQHSFAAARMQRAGLSDKVEIRLQDYRDVKGGFDKVASIEMFEAVGEKYWPAYFGKVAEVLEPGGRAALQIITIRDDLFDRYRKRADFIQRYIFPGGMLPSETALREQTRRAGLSWVQANGFGLDYAETLAEWGRRFRTAWNDIQELGFDERFKRLWQFYLSYCEAGFRSRRTDVVQLALAKG